MILILLAWWKGFLGRRYEPTGDAADRFIREAQGSRR